MRMSMLATYGGFDTMRSNVPMPMGGFSERVGLEADGAVLVVAAQVFLAHGEGLVADVHHDDARGRQLMRQRAADAAAAGAEVENAGVHLPADEHAQRRVHEYLGVHARDESSVTCTTVSAGVSSFFRDILSS